MRRLRSKKGLTLLEVMATLVITVILISTISLMTVPAFKSYNQGAVISTMEKVAAAVLLNVGSNISEAGEISLMNETFFVPSGKNISSGTYATDFIGTGALAQVVRLSYQEVSKGGQYCLVRDNQKKVTNYVPVTISSYEFNAGTYYLLVDGRYEKATGSYKNSARYYAQQQTNLKGEIDEYLNKLAILKVDINGNVVADFPIPQNVYQLCFIEDIKFWAVKKTVGGITGFYSVAVQITLCDQSQRRITRREMFSCDNMILEQKQVYGLINDDDHYASYYLNTIMSSPQDVNKSNEFTMLCYKPKYTK